MRRLRGSMPSQGQAEQPRCFSSHNGIIGKGVAIWTARLAVAICAGTNPEIWAVVNLSFTSRGGVRIGSQYLELGEASRVAVSQGASQKGDEWIFGSYMSVGFLCYLSFITHVVDGVFFFPSSSSSFWIGPSPTLDLVSTLFKFFLRNEKIFCWF